MRLPIVKHVSNFIESNGEDHVIHTVKVLETLINARGIKEEELDVIGEILSNLHGGIHVHHLTSKGKSEKDALNEFMKKVTSIGK